MRRILRVSLSMFISLVVILLLAELLARAALWHRPQQVAEAGFGYSRSGYGDLTPNLNHVERLYNIRPYFLQTNSVGLRNDREIEENAVRILAIGDSFTYGMYVHNHETFPARLEERLNQLLPVEVQVLNAGVPGYTIQDELEYLHEKGLALEPDVVILGTYTNDVFDFYPPMREIMARSVLLNAVTDPAEPPAPNPLDALLGDHLALYTALQQLRASYGQAQIERQINQVTPTIDGLHRTYQDLTFLRPQDFPDEWAAYEHTLHDMIDLLDEKGIPLVIVLFPDVAQLPPETALTEVPQQELARIAAETGTPFLDMLPVFREIGDVQSLYLMYYNKHAQFDPNAPDAVVGQYTGDGHPTPYGYLVTARLLADLLLQENLLPVQQAEDV